MRFLRVTAAAGEGGQPPVLRTPPGIFKVKRMDSTP